MNDRSIFSRSTGNVLKRLSAEWPMTEQVTLSRGAAEDAQSVQVLEGLDPFGQDREAEALRDRDHR